MYISALLLAVSLSYHPPPQQLVASGVTVIAPTRSLAFPQESGTVEVKLRATTSSLPVWGMLPVSIELRNATGTPIPYSAEMLSGQGHGNASLLAKVLATGSERPMTLALIPSHLRGEGFGRTVQMLDPGEKVNKRLLTITGNYGLVSQDGAVTMKFLSAFPQPGEYEVRVVYRLGEEVYSSNTLRVAVTPPAANGVAALEYIGGMLNRR